jgi:hypothetical protein
MIDNSRLLKVAEQLKDIPHLNITKYLPTVPLSDLLLELSQFTNEDFQPYTNGLVNPEYLKKLQSKWRGLCLIEYCREGRHHIDYKTVDSHNLTFHSDGGCYPTDIGNLMPKTVRYLQTITANPDRSRLLRLSPGGDASWHSHYKLAKSGITNIDGESVLNPVIQIPLVTNARVSMLVAKDDPRTNRACKRYTAHYKPGEVWIFNSYHYHNVVNEGESDRDHIMVYAQLDDEKLLPILERAVKEYHDDRIT